MNEREFARVLDDVSACYTTPRDLWNDVNLTTDQKIKALRQWEQDLRLMAVATEENMPPSRSDRNADTLQEVHNLLERAGALEEAPVPTKTA